MDRGNGVPWVGGAASPWGTASLDGGQRQWVAYVL